MDRLQNSIKEARERAGFSQTVLADRSGVSRSEISAIETGRLSPSTGAALRLAAALGASVESLFSIEADARKGHAAWAWEPVQSTRHWVATVAGRRWRYPAEALATGEMDTDETRGSAVPAPDTFVLASCDPAVGLLARRLEARGLRTLCFTRSSREALELLKAGVVDAAGVHLGSRTAHNARAARAVLGKNFRLIHIADWEEGLAFDSARHTLPSTAAGLARLRWVGRAPGSGARKCSDALLGDMDRAPRGYDRFAHDHRGVADAIRTGWAEVGVCVRLAASDAGLNFKSLATEAFDLCVREDAMESPKIAALLATVRAPDYKRSLAGLPGFDPTQCGDLAAS